MDFAPGMRFCSKAGVCYGIVGIDENTVSLMNVQNSTIVAYKSADLELFLPVFEGEDPACVF